MFKKIITLSIVLVTVLSFTLVGCTNKDKDTILGTEINNDFAGEITNTQHVVLRMSSPMSSPTGSVSKTITATVLPETATNKAVDWSVEWADSTNPANVSEYVTVVPISNGSTTATVTCYKAFSGNAVVTVTTRENGYTANCVITFIGIPTEMNLSGSINPSGGTYYLGVGKAYDFNVNLSNPFNSVGAQYNNFSCYVTGVGSMVLGYMEHYNTNNTDKWFDTNNKTVTLDSMKNSFLTASYSNGILKITTIKTIESYYASYKSMDGGRTRAYTDKFRYFVDDCYFRIYVTESVSGLSKEILVRFDPAVVTNVAVNLPEISF